MLCVPCNRPAQAAEVREFKARVCDSEIVFDNHFGVQGIVKMNLDLPPGFCYLDYNATAPMSEAVRQFLITSLQNGFFGNPSTPNAVGQQAKAALDTARAQVAEFIGCHSDEIIFTSGGSESANYALRGVASLHPGCHIVTTAFEHYVVPKNISHFLEPAGHSVTVVGVLANGLVDMEAFTAALTPNTRMVSVMLVQNETGIVQPIREICDAAHQVGALVHVDACQAAGKIPINVVDLGADVLSIAGHKFSGPPGTGALFVRRGLEIQPLIVGAMQQGGRRAGTEAVMNCCAMGVACQEAQRWLSGNGPFFQRGTRGRVVQFIKMWCRDHDVPVVFHGEGSPVVPTVISVAFPGVTSHEIQHELRDEVAFSVGAACNSGKVSATLSAMGVARDVALGTCRISFGKDTTEDYIKRGILKIMEACKARLSSK